MPAIADKTKKYLWNMSWHRPHRAPNYRDPQYAPTNVCPQPATGITLIEVISVMAIVAVLMGLLLVGVQSARQVARRMKCESHIRQIAMGAAHYADSHRALPPGSTKGFSLHVAILPYVGRADLYDLANYSYFHDAGAKPLRAESVPLYICPSDGSPTAHRFGEVVTGSNYVGNAGGWYLMTPFNGAFRYWDNHDGAGPPLRIPDFVDGTSNTAMISEILRADGTSLRLRAVWITPWSFGPSELL